MSCTSAYELWLPCAGSGAWSVIVTTLQPIAAAPRAIAATTISSNAAPSRKAAGRFVTAAASSRIADDASYWPGELPLVKMPKSTHDSSAARSMSGVRSVFKSQP